MKWKRGRVRLDGNRVLPTVWSPIEAAMPSGKVLLWSGGRPRIGIAVPAPSDPRGWVFMDPDSDELLPWPTHWTALPSLSPKR